MRLCILLILVVLLTGLLYAGKTYSAPFTSGEKFAEHMKENDKAQDGKKEVDWFKVGLFIGLIGGVYDACDGAFFCAAAEEPTQGQIVSIVSKFMKEHQERWQEPAVVLISVCKKTWKFSRVNDLSRKKVFE
ncbi:MAG: hypothetical protein MRJ65_07600 [Candidatus Brocadiaceae bacterium]|nr:hypothetical protein [Candidatus Brocadiaceae bacterium]